MCQVICFRVQAERYLRDVRYPTSCQSCRWIVPCADDHAKCLAAATERAEAAEARAEAEARAAETAQVERENMKTYLTKKHRMYKELQSALEDCKQHMLAHGLELPMHRMPQNEVRAVQHSSCSLMPGPQLVVSCPTCSAMHASKSDSFMICMPGRAEVRLGI